MAERMSIVFQLDPEAAAASGPPAPAHPLCGAMSVEYCATCSAAFAKIKAMVRCLEVCVSWRHGEALPALRIGPAVDTLSCCIHRPSGGANMPQDEIATRRAAAVVRGVLLPPPPAACAATLGARAA